jgi:hypothetical protein
MTGSRQSRPTDQQRLVLHYQAALVPDEDRFTARCLKLGCLCAHGRNVDEALARLRDRVAIELSHRSDHPRPPPWSYHGRAHARAGPC